MTWSVCYSIRRFISLELSAIWYRLYLYVYLILYAINYCMFDMYDAWYCMILIIVLLVRVMQPPCMLNVVPFTVCLLVHLACICLATLWSTKRPRKFGSRVCFEIDWQPRNFGAYDLKATARTLSELVLFGCVDILLWRVVELFCKSTTERNVVVQRQTSSLSVPYQRGRCCSTSNDLSGRIVSTWTLLLIVGRLFGACYFVVDAVVQRGPSARRFPEVSWSVNGSGRVVPFHLIGSYLVLKVVQESSRVSCEAPFPHWCGIWGGALPPPQNFYFWFFFPRENDAFSCVLNTIL